jgi:hypothetical protein
MWCNMQALRSEHLGIAAWFMTVVEYSSQIDAVRAVS